MTKTATKAIPASDVIVFGLGPNKRPQAALFPAQVAALAMKAAAQLNLTAIKVSGNVAALVHKLPAGLHPQQRPPLHPPYTTKALRPAGRNGHVSRRTFDGRQSGCRKRQRHFQCRSEERSGQRR